MNFASAITGFILAIVFILGTFIVTLLLYLLVIQLRYWVKEYRYYLSCRRELIWLLKRIRELKDTRIILPEKYVEFAECYFPNELSYHEREAKYILADTRLNAKRKEKLKNKVIDYQIRQILCEYRK